MRIKKNIVKIPQPGMFSAQHGQIIYDESGKKWIDYVCRVSHSGRDIWRKYFHKTADFEEFLHDEFPFRVYVKTKEKRYPNPTYLAKIPEQAFDRFVYVGFHGINRLRNYAQERGLV